MTTPLMHELREGMDVFDAQDEKIGTLAENAGGLLRVPSGFLGLGKEHYIPLSAVREVQDGAIYLSVDKDRLGELEADPSALDLDEDFEGTDVTRTTSTVTNTLEPVSHDARMMRDDDDAQTMQLREEELTARKRSVQTGEVTLGKEVVTEQRTIDVPVTHEEVTIERRPIDRRASDRPIGEAEEVIEVPVHEEQVQLTKQTMVYEQVGVDKRVVQETQHVSETVRREEAVITADGDVDVEADAIRRG